MNQTRRLYSLALPLFSLPLTSNLHCLRLSYSSPTFAEERLKTTLHATLQEILKLPSTVRENLKWIFEKRVRPQNIALLLALAKAGALDNPLAEGLEDTLGLDTLKVMFHDMQVGDLATVEEAVASLTNDKVRLRPPSLTVNHLALTLTSLFFFTIAGLDEEDDRQRPAKVQGTFNEEAVSNVRLQEVG